MFEGTGPDVDVGANKDLLEEFEETLHGCKYLPVRFDSKSFQAL